MSPTRARVFDAPAAYVGVDEAGILKGMAAEGETATLSFGAKVSRGAMRDLSAIIPGH